MGVGLALAGCSSDLGSSGTIPPLRPFASASATRLSDAPTSGLPIEQYILGGRDLYSVQAADVILAQECMAKQGFTIQLPPPAPLGMRAMDFTYRRYGAPDSLADAQEFGYQIPVAARTRPTTAIISFRQSATPEVLTALMGSPSLPADSRYRNGCLGVADRQLMQGATEIQASGLAAPAFIRELNDDPRATDSPAVRADMKVFAACMAEAGYARVPSPLEVPAQFDNAQAAKGPPSSAQISAAVIEFKCRQSSGVEAAMRAAEVAFELEAIDANPEKFILVKQELDDVVRRATTIVAGGG